uniref:Uncharacterized protein n=1 Tax=Plectus sambesii TaxID=2011161 RepID=A0A914UQ09_9BILA
LFFAEDTNPADDYPGGSDEEDERPKEDAPWYEKYAESIIFAGGAIMGALAAGVVAAAVSKKSDKKEEKK